MRALITGGAGFIGSHLAERHLHMGDQVAIIDNLSTGSITNIQHLEDAENFTILIDDVLNVELMRQLVADCDLIYHLAAAVGVDLIIDNPLQSLTTNIRGTEIILELANEKKKKVILGQPQMINTLKYLRQLMSSWQLSKKVLEWALIRAQLKMNFTL